MWREVLLEDHDRFALGHHRELLGALLGLLVHLENFLLPAPQHFVSVLIQALRVGLLEATIHLFLEELVLGSKQAFI